MKRLFFVFLFLLCSALLIIFSIANMETVPLKIFPNQPFPLLGYEEKPADDASSDGITTTVPREIPVFLLIFLSFGSGFVAASFFSILMHLKNKREIGKLKKVIKKNEDEINSLRLIPIKEVDKNDKKENEI